MYKQYHWLNKYCIQVFSMQFEILKNGKYYDLYLEKQEKTITINFYEIIIRGRTEQTNRTKSQYNNIIISDIGYGNCSWLQGTVYSLVLYCLIVYYFHHCNFYVFLCIFVFAVLFFYCFAFGCVLILHNTLEHFSMRKS